MFTTWMPTDMLLTHKEPVFSTEINKCAYLVKIKGSVINGETHEVLHGPEEMEVEVHLELSPTKEKMRSRSWAEFTKAINIRSSVDLEFNKKIWIGLDMYPITVVEVLSYKIKE